MIYFIVLVHSVVSNCLEKEEESHLIEYSKTQYRIEESCICYAISKNWTNAANTLIKNCLNTGQELSEDLLEDLEDTKKTNKNLITTIENKAYQLVSPAFQWAQSPNKVYLNIKFSHRLEAPGCNSIKDSIVNITETKVFFLGFCEKSSQKIKFLLDLELFKKIVVNESSFSFGSVGKLNFELSKKRGDIWDLPVKGKKPKNMHIWWEMKNKFAKEMDAITGGDDKDPDAPSQFDGLLNNPNVKIENSYIDGKYVDNTKEDEDL